MIKDCWIECWLRVNTWDSENHTHGFLGVEGLGTLPAGFTVVDGRPVPFYKEVVKDDPIGRKINEWFETACDRPCKSINQFTVRVWKPPRELMLSLIYDEHTGWRPHLLVP